MVCSLALGTKHEQEQSSPHTLLRAGGDVCGRLGFLSDLFRFLVLVTDARHGDLLLGCGQRIIMDRLDP